MSLTFEYKHLVKQILSLGIEQDCRNGSQLIIPHFSFTLDHSKAEEHILKLRKMWYKGVQGEFDTLISLIPLTNVSQFEANGCNYWKDWADEHGNLNLDYYNMMHPQLENLIYNIKKDPTSRRHRLELWNPDNVQEGTLSLPCCWHGHTYTIIDGVLHLTWIQRSVDVMVGLPADIYLSYLFMSHIARLCDLQVGTCMYSLSNVHIYAEHLDNAHLLLKRTEEDSDKPLKFQLKE